MHHIIHMHAIDMHRECTMCTQQQHATHMHHMRIARGALQVEAAHDGMTTDSTRHSPSSSSHWSARPTPTLSPMRENIRSKQTSTMSHKCSTYVTTVRTATARMRALGPPGTPQRMDGSASMVRTPPLLVQTKGARDDRTTTATAAPAIKPEQPTPSTLLLQTVVEAQAIPIHTRSLPNK
jgi:hypothetical protein